MAKQIFIIVDPQTDFTHPEGAYAKRHTGITQIAAAKANINHLLNSLGKENFIVIQSDYRPNQFGEGLSLCLPGTPGHALDKELNLNETIPLFRKTAHSAFSSPPFRNYLERKTIDTLVVCGFLAEYCVQQTALDALEAGYAVQLPNDCIGTGDDVQYRKQQMMAELLQKGATLTNRAFYCLH